MTQARGPARPGPGADPPRLRPAAPAGGDRRTGSRSWSARCPTVDMLGRPPAAGRTAHGRPARGAGAPAVPADRRARLRRAPTTGAPLLAMTVRDQDTCPLGEVLQRLPDVPIALTGGALRHRRRHLRGDRAPGPRRRDRPGRGRQLRHQALLHRRHHRLHARPRAHLLPPAADRRVGRLLDVPRAHRRPHLRRRHTGAARQPARRHGGDEPDQRHLPLPAVRARPAGRDWTSSPTARRPTSCTWSWTRNSR